MDLPAIHIESEGSHFQPRKRYLKLQCVPAKIGANLTFFRQRLKHRECHFVKHELDRLRWQAGINSGACQGAPPLGMRPGLALVPHQDAVPRVLVAPLGQAGREGKMFRENRCRARAGGGRGGCEHTLHQAEAA